VDRATKLTPAVAGVVLVAVATVGWDGGVALPVEATAG